MPDRTDVIVIGGGHNGLVAAILLSKAGLKVTVLEGKGVLGGATRTEHPFAKAPKLGASTGAYLLGLAPPELLAELEVDLPLRRRDPHYFLPTTGSKYLLFGSDKASMRRQFLEFFSEADWLANEKLNAETAALRDDVAKSWLEPPLSVEETAERHVRPELREVFVRMCRGTIREYLDRFGFESALVKAMYAVTDAFSGAAGCYDTPGTGHNFFAHNMCRLPGADGTWMIVEGGMGTVAQRFADRARTLGATLRTDAKVARIEIGGGVVRGVLLESGERIEAKAVVSNADPFTTRDLVGDAFPAALSQRLDEMQRDGTTFKLNLAFKHLPKFTCLPEDRGQFGPTIHLLPDEDVVEQVLTEGHRDAMNGRLAEHPSIEWYFHTPIDPSLRDPEGHENAALFVQWVPRVLADGKTWAQEETRYAHHLLSICDRFAPGTSDLVVDMFPLSPEGIEKHFGIRYGHIQHIDNGFAFADRVPHRLGIDGLYSCSAGTHPAGGVAGAAGHNAAKALLADLGR